MGQPYHYGIEIPGRCLQLIDGLWDQARQLYGIEDPDLGPLTSTFLISMSMPTINLPIERIERHIDKREGYADERHISDDAVKAFVAVIRKGTLGKAPFFEENAWSFTEVLKEPLFNAADGLPSEIAERLSDQSAMDNARKMPAQQWVSIVRNALAHGGVTYLDEDGRSGHGRPVKMYAFISGKYGRRVCEQGEGHCPAGLGELQGLRVLRISEDHFRNFLRKWVIWLGESRIDR